MINSPQWAEYTATEHYREIPFVHFTDERDWRAGSFDLYRPGDPESLVVDFKTHPVKAGQAAPKVADDYTVQVEVYRKASEVAGPADVRLEFTGLADRGGPQ